LKGNISKTIEALLAFVSIHNIMSMKYNYKIKVFEDLKIWLIVSNPNKSQENKKGWEKKNVEKYKSNVLKDKKNMKKLVTKMI